MIIAGDSAKSAGTPALTASAKEVLFDFLILLLPCGSVLMARLVGARDIGLVTGVTVSQAVEPKFPGHTKQLEL